jgi:hypothetical protein
MLQLRPPRKDAAVTPQAGAPHHFVQPFYVLVDFRPGQTAGNSAIQIISIQWKDL